MDFKWAEGDHATCPKCGESWGDLWDYGWHANDTAEINCPHCEAKLTLRREVSVEYAVASGWNCYRCDGSGNTYSFREKCKNRQCDHGLGDRPMSCPVDKSVCETCNGKAVFYE